MFKLLKKLLYKNYIHKKKYTEYCSDYHKRYGEAVRKVFEKDKELLHTLLHADTIFYSKSESKRSRYFKNLLKIRIKIYELIQHNINFTFSLVNQDNYHFRLIVKDTEVNIFMSGERSIKKAVRDINKFLSGVY